MKRIVIMAVVIVLATAMLTGCMPGDGKNNAEKKAGFFTGIWHGWIAPISLVVSLFNHSIRVYETANTGWWYDFGFYIAIIGGFGGLALTRKRFKDSSRR